MLANCIDALIVTVVVGSFYLGWVGLQFLLDPRSFTWPDTRWLVTLTTWLFVATAYLALAWWLAAGRTYGDHVMGLRVMGRRGRRLGPLRSLMRAAFCVFFPIGLFWCIVSPKRRSVQDALLWTKVVYDWTPRPHVVHAPPAHGVGADVVESVVVADGSESPAAADAAVPRDPPRRLPSRNRVAPPVSTSGAVADSGPAPTDGSPDTTPVDGPAGSNGSTGSQ